MGEIDLHIHTTASDGMLTPSQVVRLAKERNLKAIAITDHDSIDGVREALDQGRRVSLEVIPGVEISANSKAGNLHLLGYYVQTEHGILKEKLDRLKQARSERNPNIVRKLNALGVDISYPEVIQVSGGGQVGRPHFARVLRDKRYVRTIDEAFDRYLGQGAPAYVDKFRFDVKEGIEIVSKAGGVPVLAHPYSLNCTAEDLEEMVSALARDGLKGIEAFYPDHTPKQTAHYQRLAEKLDLVTTGGADFHGPLITKAELGIIGQGISLTYATVEALKRARQTAGSR
jgi:predicted metal-dependent phosphoesterase TrpH